jgi:diguanylate cyclase (GGDEF)-like protein
VEVIRSQREVLAETGWLAIGSALLGGLAFLALRAVPLRLLRRAVERSHHLATHDQLTGLPNRTLFRDRLGQAAAAARRDGLPLAVLALDLDRFKETNDTLGHAAGDELLRQVAQRLAAGVRESDTVARLGGDEFAIIQRSATQPRDAESLARRLIAAVAEPYDLFGNRVTIGVSIGIALGPAVAPEELLRDADTALYRAKAEGRNTFRFFEAAMNAALRERRAMERDLRQALATGQLRLYFQPQVDLPSGRAVGLEALLRWEHPERGLLPPSAFIDLAEETGLLTAMGEWVLREACAVALRWPGLRMAVNISASQFQGTDFVRSVQQALAATGLEPGRLEIEITEGVLLTDTERTLEVLEALHALGVSVAMDDFGTGYSSLGYLQKFRFDKIKIDRRFVEHLGEDPRAMAIVRAVLGITQALGVRANAEGVEHLAEAELLAAEGCAEAQGYLFGRPVPEAELAALVGELGRARAA